MTRRARFGPGPSTASTARGPRTSSPAANAPGPTFSFDGTADRTDGQLRCLYQKNSHCRGRTPSGWARSRGHRTRSSRCSKTASLSRATAARPSSRSFSASASTISPLSGERVYAAARESGLLISDDGGRSWQSITRFTDPADPDRILRPDVDVAAVATTPSAVWVGTLNGEGVFKSEDGGATWQRFRTDVPLRPDTPTPDVLSVETYAYPNPFSPARRPPRSHPLRRRARGRSRSAHFRLRHEPRPPPLTKPDVQGARSRGMGLDEGGLRVANGTYFYDVRTGGETARGKILVLE